jgi:hypothetical protein
MQVFSNNDCGPPMTAYGALDAINKLILIVTLNYVNILYWATTVVSLTASWFLTMTVVSLTANLSNNDCGPAMTAYGALDPINKLILRWEKKMQSVEENQEGQG